jgi:Tfp pilus assembly protein PilX
MNKRLNQERGFALATAVIVMTLMLMFGLAMMAMVDNQTRQSGRERVKETAYNVAEATLSNEIFSMSKPWPGTASQALSDCTRASTSVRCPDASRLSQGFQNTEFSSSTAWTVSVRDNLGSAGSYYRRSVVDTTSCPSPTGGTAAPCTWDSNRDGLLWVRAQSTVAGKTRTLVTLARQQQVGITLPLNTVLAGRFATSNNGKKVIVDERGCQATGAPPGGCLSSQSAPVAVRCSLTPAGTQPSPGNSCLGYDPAKGQLDPDNYVTNFQGVNSGCPNGYSNCAMTQAQIDQLKRRAVADGTYYASSCPPQPTNGVVFIDNPPSGSCSYTGGTWNSPSTPGMIVLNHGTLSLGGNITYYGIIYSANNNSSPANAGDIISLTGTATIQGAIMVEGPGGVQAGSSKVNVVFDPNAGQSVYGYDDSAAIAQNSYRELPTGQ